MHALCLFVQFVSPDLPGYVGFANLPNQVHRKSVKKGFEFTLMVVGKYARSTVNYLRRRLAKRRRYCDARRVCVRSAAYSV